MSASLRFLVTNRAIGATLKNGTGGGAPALDEVAPYTMDHALREDRRDLWQSSAGANMQFDIDLGSNITIGAGGVAGHRALVGNGLAEFALKYSTAVNGYPPTSGNPWTTAPGCSAVTVGSARRDKLQILNNAGVPATQSARYWRWDIALTAGGDKWTVGKLVLGALDYDLGALYSPGMRQRSLVPQIEGRTAGLDPVLTYTGDQRYLFSLPYQSITAAMRSTLDALAKLRQSFFMLDEEDTAREVVVQAGEFEVEHRRVIIGAGVDAVASSRVINAELNLEQLA